MTSEDSPLGGEFELSPEDFSACPGEAGLPDFGHRANIACSTGRDALYGDADMSQLISALEDFFTGQGR